MAKKRADKYEHLIPLRVTREQLKKIAAAANKVGMPTATYARVVVLREVNGA
jgi:predicted DNA binding CopG/RHH family protein